MSTGKNEISLENPPAQFMGRAAMLRNDPFPLLKTRIDQILRRGLDIVISGLGLLFLWPLFVLIGWAIKRDSPGPVYYHGWRAGWHGKPFKIHKFRTMYERVDSYSGPKVTASGDERITPYGKWLRATKVNELPQFWNVFVGDMSLVGPRPEDLDIAKDWPEALRKEILSIRPGITSPATVVYRDEENQLDAGNLMHDYFSRILPSKLRLDLLYVRNRSILTDIDMLFWTVVALLPNMREVKIPEERLLFGPFTRIFSRYISWFSLDTLCAFVTVSLSGVLWRIEAPLNLGVKWAIVFAFITSLVFSVTNYIFGLHRVEWRRASWQYVFPLWFSSLVATGGLLVADRLLLRNFLPDLMVAMAGAFSFLGFTVLRYRDRLITGAASRWINLRNPARTLGEHILVVGAGENFSLATWLLSRNEYSAAYTIIGILDDDPRKKGSVIEGHRVLGNTKDIPNLVSKLDVGVILFTIDNINATERQRILDLCRQTTAHIVLLPEAIDHFRTQMRKGFNQDLTVEMDGNGHHPDLQPISPAEVRDWIDQLGNLAEEGDIQTLRQRLDSLKQELNQKTTFE